MLEELQIAWCPLCQSEPSPSPDRGLAWPGISRNLPKCARAQNFAKSAYYLRFSINFCFTPQRSQLTHIHTQSRVCSVQPRIPAQHHPRSTIPWIRCQWSFSSRSAARRRAARLPRRARLRRRSVVALSSRTARRRLARARRPCARRAQQVRWRRRQCTSSASVSAR